MGCCRKSVEERDSNGDVTSDDDIAAAPQPTYVEPLAPRKRANERGTRRRFAESDAYSVKGLLFGSPPLFEDDKNNELVLKSTLSEYKKIECLNVYTTCLLLQLTVSALILVSFSIIIVHYTNNLYEPVAIPSTIHASGFGWGIMQLAFDLDSLMLLGFAGGWVFASLFISGFSIVAGGNPPFATAGISLFNGRNVTAATDVSKATTILTVRYGLIIANMVFGLLTVMFIIYMIGRVGHKGRRPFWIVKEREKEKRSFLRYRGNSHFMRACYVTTGFAWLFALGVLIDLSLAGNYVDGRASGMQYIYSWVRYDSPHFILCVGVGMRLLHPTPYPETNSDMAFMYRRASYFTIRAFVLLLGASISLYYMFAEYVGRLLANTPAYRAQIMATNNLDIGQTCFLNTQCYALVNPVYDGSATYTLIKSPFLVPQSFAANTFNEDFCNLWLVIFGICVAGGNLFEYVVLSCGTAWSRGIDPLNEEIRETKCETACLAWSGR